MTSIKCLTVYFSVVASLGLAGGSATAALQVIIASLTACRAAATGVASPRTSATQTRAGASAR